MYFPTDYVHVAYVYVHFVFDDCVDVGYVPSGIFVVLNGNVARVAGHTIGVRLISKLRMDFLGIFRVLGLGLVNAWVVSESGRIFI